MAGRQRDAQEHAARGAGQRPTSRPSAKYCAASCPRPAPSATRIAVSRARATERASSSPAAFAHVIRNSSAGRGEQQQQRRADVLDDRLAKIEQTGRVGGMIDRILGGDLRSDAFHVRLGGGERDSRLPPAYAK